MFVLATPIVKKVLDGSNDKYLVEQGVYPASAIQYPNGKTTGIVSVFQTKTGILQIGKYPTSRLIILTIW